EYNKTYQDFYPLLSYSDSSINKRMYSSSFNCGAYSYAWQQVKIPGFGEAGIKGIFYNEEEYAIGEDAFRNGEKKLWINLKPETGLFTCLMDYNIISNEVIQKGFRENVHSDNFNLKINRELKRISIGINGSLARNNKFLKLKKPGEMFELNSRMFGQAHLTLNLKPLPDSKLLFYNVSGFGEKQPVLKRMWKNENNNYIERNNQLSPSHFVNEEAGFSVGTGWCRWSSSFILHNGTGEPELSRIGDSLFMFVNTKEIKSYGAQTHFNLAFKPEFENMFSWSCRDITISRQKWMPVNNSLVSFFSHSFGHILRYYKPFMGEKLQTELIWKNYYTPYRIVYSFAENGYTRSKGFWTTDLRLGFRIGNFRLFYCVDNLYNEVVEWEPEHTMPGFNIFWGIHWQISESGFAKKAGEVKFGTPVYFPQ
ncbi:MAG: hypothetical protein ABIA63_00555, partial [bacterium]